MNRRMNRRIEQTPQQRLATAEKQAAWWREHIRLYEGGAADAEQRLAWWERQVDAAKKEIVDTSRAVEAVAEAGRAS